MNDLKTELKNIFSNKKLIMNTVNMHIQPFKQMPSVHNTGQESADDLFTHYTAEIIKADKIFVR